MLTTYRSPLRYMGRYQQDPFISVHGALQRTLDDLLEGSLTTPAASLAIKLDVKEDGTAFHVTADMPGLTEKDVDVTFDDGVLTIKGEKKIERDEKDEKQTWHVIERSHGSFARRLSLPSNIQADKIEAKFEKGVLSITLPKVPAEQTSAKKINIKTA